MQSIPKLDLSHFTEGSAEQKSQFVAALGNAYEQIGFVAYAIIVFHQTH